MKALHIIGEYVFEYIVITLLLAVSLVLVLPFIPMFIGVVEYFTHRREDRMLKDIFVAIKENWKIIIIFTIFELLLLVFSGLNIYFMRTHVERRNMFILVISYVGLALGILFMSNSPIVILRMKVNFGQLLLNNFLLFFGGFINCIISVVAVGLYVVLGAIYPYLTLPTIYFVALCVAYFTNKNLINLKAKKLNTTAKRLIDKEKEDNFFEN